MNDERWKHVADLYQAAQERAPEERSSFVRECTAGDSALRREVESLLAQDDATLALDAPLVDVVRTLLADNAATLQPGSFVGPCRIDSLLDKGGMGEVYSARDTKLHRDVAIKILPSVFAADPEKLARFKREPQLLAALNHPNIAAIYGLEDANGTPALVMELIKGPTLADRIRKGAIPLDEALPIARQIAEALTCAHEAGIVHRDLKPANIKVREDGTVKVLDFGLAKLADPVGAATGVAAMTQSPTITTSAMTASGMILGTAAYMPPEQAKGRQADKRSDVWAFGCVLYEMLTGRRAFGGGDAADTLVAVLQSEPDWTALPRDTPVVLRRLLRHCLAKDPRGRFGDAAIARIEIDDILSDPTVARDGVQLVGRRQTHLMSAAAAVVALVGLTGVGASVWKLWPGSPTLRPARFTIALPAGQRFSSLGNRPLTVSPDGGAVVYSANLQLHLRMLDQLEAGPIRGSQGGGRSPFFSPDGQSIGFWQGEQFKKVSVAGGAPVVLCSAPDPWGVSWTAENTILYGGGPEGIWRVSADGGKPQKIVAVDAGQIASGPQLLPGGRAILFTLANPKDANANQIVVQSLGTGKRTVIVEAGTDARYVPTGHLVYALRNSLLAVPFDLATLAVTAEPVPILQDVAMSPDAVTAYFAVSNEGTLIYVPRDAVGRLENWTPAWVDRQGRELPIKAPPRPYLHPRLSPDGARIAVDVRDQEDDIWILDLARETPMRLTFGPAVDSDPLWTPDGQSVIFSSGTRGVFGVQNIFRRAADGSGTLEQLTHNTEPSFSAPKAVTPDGKGLIFIYSTHAAAAAGDQGDVMLLPLEGDQRPTPLVQTPFSEANAELAPGGRWLAYQSNESGQQEIYVRPFPNVAAQKVRVSPNGGTSPLWARSGRELFYTSMGALMSVPVSTGSTFTADNPIKLFEGTYFFGSGIGGRTYDTSPDGQRFLMLRPSIAGGEPAPSERLVLLQNWFVELGRRVPRK
jgi:serine/threonine-protein kinase